MDAVVEAVLDRRTLLAAGIGALLGGCMRPQSSYHGTTYPWHRTQPLRPRGVTYAVVRGDTLNAISRRSGVPVRDIMVANRLGSTTIVPGQHLWLPGAAGIRPAPRPPAAVEPDPGPAGVDWPGGYKIIPRRHWTKASIKKNHYKMKRITRITVHHTGEYAGMVGLGDVEIIRRIDSYHRTGRKWAAIGYHYLIGRDGRIFQGRPETIQGAHTSGANKYNLGISVMGDFQRKLPNRAQLVALRNFLDDTRRRLRIRKSRIYGHRDLSRSTCPGAKLYGWLKSFKNS